MLLYELVMAVIDQLADFGGYLYLDTIDKESKYPYINTFEMRI
jgi:hypothetical protein